MPISKINTSSITDNSVTAGKIVAGAVDADIAAGSIDTAQMADDAVTADKLANAINTSIAAKAPIASPTFTGTTTANLLATNGNILGLQANGTTFGNIGVEGDNLYITGQAGNTGGIYMNDAAVSPAYQGAERDNYYNLGKAPARWKDLYLSGGAYLGGTGAANKLEDYEEGAFLPFVQATGDNCTGLSFTLGYYTKIGRLVNLSFNVWGTITSASAETNIKFALPFSAINSGNQAAGGSANFYMGTGTDRFSVGAIWNGSGEYTSSHIYIPASAMNASGAISGMAVSMTYLTP